MTRCCVPSWSATQGVDNLVRRVVPRSRAVNPDRPSRFRQQRAVLSGLALAWKLDGITYADVAKVTRRFGATALPETGRFLCSDEVA